MVCLINTIKEEDNKCYGEMEIKEFFVNLK